ncbi:hotdog fold thioesterase [Pasteurellaceae bacterium LIM206]|nr:hotdog fold thioesterase [Pasteurellaceae bacterium LIM206]
MKIWHKDYTLDQLNAIGEHCSLAYLGIRFTAIGEDWLEATMPVDERTKQPFGLLNGGLSVALAESLGSVAGNCVLPDGLAAVGAEVNASHLRPTTSGVVTARATPVKLGKTLQVWQIDIRNEQNKLCCTSRLTLSIIKKHNA